MSNDRTNGSIPSGARPSDDPPQTLQELLDLADKDWKLARKDKAFARVLTAIAMISQGTAEAMKTSQSAIKVARVALDNADKSKDK